MLDFPVPVHHQFQGRGLHPANRDQGVAASAAVGQGHGPAQVHTHQPIGAGAAASGVAQPSVIAVGPQRRGLKGSAQGALAEVRQPGAQSAPAPAQVLQYFVHQQLALAIRIAAVDYQIRLLEQAADYLELVASGSLGQQLPLLGQNR